MDFPQIPLDSSEIDKSKLYFKFIFSYFVTRSLNEWKKAFNGYHKCFGKKNSKTKK